MFFSLLCCAEIIGVLQMKNYLYIYSHLAFVARESRLGNEDHYSANFRGRFGLWRILPRYCKYAVLPLGTIAEDPHRTIINSVGFDPSFHAR